MGMFKDMRELRKTAKKQKRPSLREGLKMANEAMQDHQADQELAQRLVSSGIDGEATVKQLRATGKQVNMQPELEMDLSVSVGGSTTDLTHTQVVSPAIMGQLQPGSTVPVKVDPEDHSQLMIGLG